MGVKLADIPLFPRFDIAPIASETFRASLRRDLGTRGPVLIGLDPVYAYQGPR